MAKPHLDFALRENIDGTEELYSQNTEWELSEQKFTTAQLASYILAQIPPVGETNTGSNIGSAGVGVFDGKVNEDLQFRNIVAKSNKITVNLKDKNIEIDVNPEEIIPTLIFTDLEDVSPPEEINTVISWDGETYHWIERGVSNAKNIGTEGIGVFDSKNNFEFDFRNIAAKSPKVLVSLSGKNIEVDVNPEAVGNALKFKDLNDINAPEGNDVILHWNGTSYDWIETPAGGGAANASNGLSLNTDYELGGILSKNTLIDAGTYEFDIKHKTVAVKAFATNPFWASGDESFFLHAKNDARDTENIVGVTDQNGNGGIIQLWSRKPNDGTFAYLWQTPGTTNFSCKQNSSGNRTEVTFTHNGVIMDNFHQNSSQDRGTFTMTENLSQFKRVKSGYTVNLRYQEKTTSQHNLEVLFEGIPEYADVATAQSQGYPSKGLFKTPTGAVFIVP